MGIDVLKASMMSQRFLSLKSGVIFPHMSSSKCAINDQFPQYEQIKTLKVTTLSAAHKSLG